jgi:hypothetical protein
MAATGVLDTISRTLGSLPLCLSPKGEIELERDVLQAATDPESILPGAVCAHALLPDVANPVPQSRYDSIRANLLQL